MDKERRWTKICDFVSQYSYDSRSHTSWPSVGLLDLLDLNLWRDPRALYGKRDHVWERTNIKQYK